MAVELKNRIAVDLGVNVPMVKFLQGPSVEQAAAQLLDLAYIGDLHLDRIPLPTAICTPRWAEKRRHRFAERWKISTSFRMRK